MKPEKLEQTFVTAEALICERPCFLYSVIVEGHATLVARFTVRNGFDTNAERLFAAALARGQSGFFRFDVPVYFSRGLFFDNTEQCQSAMFQYELRGR